jgi:NH3-dependent NAD+ synthetase
MKYCKKCLQLDTRPGSNWTSEHQCPACDYHDSLKTIYWPERLKILDNILSDCKNKKQNNTNFDCIIGVSGGKDSTRQALFIRDRLGLNPLLVCMSYPPSQVTQLGCDNLSNLIKLGFDIEIIGVSPIVWKKLIKQAFYKFSNWAKAT